MIRVRILNVKRLRIFFDTKIVIICKFVLIRRKKTTGEGGL